MNYFFNSSRVSQTEARNTRNGMIEINRVLIVVGIKVRLVSDDNGLCTVIGIGINKIKDILLKKGYVLSVRFYHVSRYYRSNGAVLVSGDCFELSYYHYCDAQDLYYFW